MKAAVWYGKKDVRVVDVPEPQAPKPGWVKIEVKWCGICGSDLHEYLAGPIFIPVDAPHPLTGAKAPLILGHEFSGKIVEVGEGVNNFKGGDRVASDACQVCWECYWCKRMEYSCCEKLGFTGLAVDGAFAKYVNVPAYTLYHLPDSMTYEQGALVEPLAVGLHAVRRAPVIAGDNVVVIGAGTIGLAALQCARVGGAKQVIVLEMAKARKEFAQKLGATVVIDPSEKDPVEEVFRLTNGIGADVTIECVGSEKTGPLSVACTRRRGIAVPVGIFERPSNLHFNDLVFTEREIKGALAYTGDFSPVISMIDDGRLDAETMITGKIGLEDIVAQGFDELVNHKDTNIKIIVSPQ
jgi:(R,R)-butanediol dehydrogenase/meso-butanediol dehydrogenase/diacetyl reductase